MMPLNVTNLTSLLVSLLLLLLLTSTEAVVQLDTFAADSPVTYAGASAHYLKQYDMCGVCDGDTTTCQGCDRVPNSPFVFDACGACANPFAFLSTFNGSCTDCGADDGDDETSGQVYGHKVLDDCGTCRDSTDPLFSRTGRPDYHLGACVGCDGVPFSGSELDRCGVCGGPGCDSSEPSLRSWCCDCAGIPFGPHIVDLCCDCVNREEHWLELSDGVFNGPPENHSLAIDFWARGRERVMNGTMELSAFRLSLFTAEGDMYNRSFSVYAPFLEALELFQRGWQAIRDPSSDDNSTCYRDVYIGANTSNPRDSCGGVSALSRPCVCTPVGRQWGCARLPLVV